MVNADRLSHWALFARLAALIPRPGVNLTRYHGIFAPNSRWRALIPLSGRGKRASGDAIATEPEKRRAITWARRLKRVFKIDVEVCEHCGGAVKIIACIQRPEPTRCSSIDALSWTEWS